MSEKRKPTHSEQEIERIIDCALGQHESFGQHDSDDSLQYEMEQAAALMDISVAESHPVEMPAGLADRLKAQVALYPEQSSSLIRDSHLSEQQSSTFSFAQASASNKAPLQWVPWMVAAASLLIATVTVFVPRGAVSTPDLNTQRLALIENTPTDELTQWNWISTDDASVVGEVIGDVVWSDTLNKGYMRISGLAINDPSMEQYQLWIFDASRPAGDLPQFGEGLLTQRPVDGGVFDINQDGEVIIEINAKLFVQNAAAFAITVEPPGGVVVSDRSRVPLLALAP
jgi:Anti-sigma-K factor rskA, C-terminal